MKKEILLTDFKLNNFIENDILKKNINEEQNPTFEKLKFKF